MYSEKSDGCMNSCIVDNSLVCGIMELYYGFLNYILATILYTLPGAAVVSLLEALTSRLYFLAMFLHAGWVVDEVLRQKYAYSYYKTF